MQAIKHLIPKKGNCEKFEKYEIIWRNIQNTIMQLKKRRKLPQMLSRQSLLYPERRKHNGSRSLCWLKHMISTHKNLDRVALYFIDFF